MTIPTIELEVKKHGLTQRQKKGDEPGKVGVVWTLSLTVNKEDMDRNKALEDAPMGTRYLAVLVELTDDDEEAAHRKADKTARHLVGTQEIEIQPPTSEQQAYIDRMQAAKITKPPKQAWDDMPLSKQAGMKCRDPQFQNYMAMKLCAPVSPTNTDFKKYGTDGAFAACRVRFSCGVDSMAQFSRDLTAGLQWKALYREYEESMGLTAEQRG